MKLSWLKHYNLLIFDEIDSTNSEAIRLAKSCVYGDFIIIAQKQTAGRGRQGKQWSSDEGNVYFSVLLDRNIETEKQPELSFVSALSLYDTIKFFADKNNIAIDIALKWPNDVLIDGKKISGILIESLSFLGRNYVVIGVGVNTKLTPPNISQPVTSLVDAGIYILDDTMVLSQFVKNFDKYFKKWQKYGFEIIRRIWESRAYKLNQNITVTSCDQKFFGQFLGVDDKGNLKLKLEDGSVVNLLAGEL